MSQPPPIPLPQDPRHQRYADLRLQNVKKTDAYMASGYKCRRSSAAAAATRVEKRSDVRAYMTAIRLSAAGDSCLDLLEIRRFLARVVRTPFAEIDPDSPEHSDLILSLSRSTSEASASSSLRKLDPLKAIEIDIKLSGDDPETNAASQLTELLLTLCHAHPIPNDTL